MSTDVFDLHIQQSLEKLEDLWQRSNAIPAPDSELWQRTQELPQQQQQLLRESLAELSASIEELQLASETLRQQNEELLASRQQIEAKKQYYQELFDLAPDCYVVTSKEGTIKEVNQKTADLLGVSAKYLSRKILAVFIDVDDRQEYYTKLNQIKQGKITSTTWKLKVINRKKDTIAVECTVIARRNPQGEITNLCWRISPSKIELKEENTADLNTDLTTIIINSIRYPLYNLVTQIEEIKTRIQDNQSLGDRLKNITNDLISIKQITNNVYILDSFQDKKDLNLSLVDYSIFIHRLIRDGNNIKQQVGLSHQDYCVGICDILLLEQIITNTINEIGKYNFTNRNIQINLSKNNAQRLLIQIQCIADKTTKEKLKKVFEPLVNPNKLKLTDNQDLNLAVVQKSISLLQGTIELESQNNNSITITIELPLISK